MRFCPNPALMLCLLACLPLATQANDDTARYEQDQSEAWHADDGQFLYGESHWLWWQGERLVERLVQYRCRGGDVFAEKRVDYRINPLAPDFHLRDARSGYEEGLRSDHGRRIVFVRRNRSEALTEAALPASADDGPIVADAGFDEFLRQRWSALQRGDVQHLAFLVPSALKPIEFKVRPVDAASGSTLTARLSLGAWWGFLAPHIDATYRRADGRLLEYVGLSNLRDLEGDNYPVRIRFQDAPKIIEQAAYVAASKQALVRTCPAEMRALESTR